MSDAFVTETLSEPIHVLCITSQPDLGQVFRTACREFGAQCEVVSVEKLSTLKNKSWYKVFWFDTPLFHTEKNASVVTEFMRNHPQSLHYCLLPLPSLLAFPSEPDLPQFSSSQVVFEVIEQRLPYSSIFFYEDVVHPLLLLDTTLGANSLPQLMNPLMVRDLVAQTWQLAGSPRGGQRKLLVSNWQINSLENVSKAVVKNQIQVGQRHYVLRGLKKISFSPSCTKKELRAELQQVIEDIVLKNPSRIISDLKLPAPSKEKPIARTDDSQQPEAVVTSAHKSTSLVEEKTPAPNPVQGDELQQTESKPALSTPEPVSNYKIKTVKVPPIYQPVIPRSKILLRRLEEQFEQLNVLAPLPHPPAPLVPAQIHDQRPFVQPAQAPQPPTISSESIENKINELFGKSQLVVPALSPSRPQAKTPPEGIKGLSEKIKNNQRRVFSKVSLKKNTKPQKKHVAFFFLGIIVLLGTSLVGGFLYTQQKVLRELYSLESSLISTDISSVTQEIPSSFYQQLLSLQNTAYSPLLPVATRQQNEQLVQLHQRVVALLKLKQNVKTEAQTALANVFSVTSDESPTTLSSLSPSVEEIYKELSLLENELVSSQSLFGSFPTEKKDRLQKSLQHISQERKRLLQLQQVLQIADEVLGSAEKKTYAVLIQDPTELRATGGFIQNILLLTFDNRRLIDTQIFTADEIDQRVGGAIAPPESLKRYLREQYWYMRDANWEADFETVQSQITWFLTKALNQPVDGVIGVNYSLWQEVLKTTGELTTENSSVTADNFAEKMLQPLSDPAMIKQHSEYTKKVSSTLFNSLKTQPSENLATIAHGIEKLLNHGEITVALTDPTHQEVIRTFGWSGKILSPACPAQFSSSSCVVSPMYQVDVNVGVNKVNYFVKKKVDHQVALKGDQTLHKHIISYENDSKSNTWPSGGYKNLLTYYLPLEANVTQVLIGSKVIETQDYRVFVEKNFKKLELLVEIPANTTNTATIEYTEKPVQPEQAFTFFLQKQPGITKAPTTITLHFGKEFIPLVIAPEATVNQEGAVFQFTGEEHAFVGIKFR